MNRVLLGAIAVLSGLLFYCPKVEAVGYSEVGQYGRPFVLVTEDTEEQIQEEIRLGELEELAQLVEAEAGNQDFEGKCLVVDVILNRVESDSFPNNIHDVIYQKNPVQFSTVYNGEFEKAAWNMKEDDYRAVMYEVELHRNKVFLFFNNSENVSGTGIPVKVGDHWFREG